MGVERLTKVIHYFGRLESDEYIPNSNTSKSRKLIPIKCEFTNSKKNKEEKPLPPSPGIGVCFLGHPKGVVLEM